MQYKNYGILKRFLFVSLGAVPGGVIRWFFSDDLLANCFGALVLGFFSGLGLRDRYKLIIAIGFAGSCTTFSTWMVNVIELMIEGNYFNAIYSLLSNVFLGLVVLAIAFYIGKKTKRSILPQ